jgi:hypothetical protein
MTRPVAIGAVLLAVFSFGGVSAAEAPSNDAQWTASTFCTYAIILESHVIATRCAMPLDAASEARYAKIIKAIRQNILDNTKATEKALTTQRLDGYESGVAEHHRADGSQVCHSTDYRGFHDMLTHFTSEKGSADLLRHFANLKRNPFIGDCL